MTLVPHIQGEGPPLLLLHGAGEDAGLLAPQAAAFAARHRRVLTYDRRGTGRTPRDGWPEAGVAGHADDAAALLRAAGAAPATVLGFSSGGVVAAELAVRHPDVVREAIAWEPPLLSLLPDGAALHTGMTAPIDEVLAARPGDWAAAFRVMLAVMSGGEADPDSPAARRMAPNAEPALRDDAPIISAHAFGPGELAAAPVVLALGGAPDPLHAAIAERFAEVTGRAPLVVAEAKDHEVYLDDPEVLAAALADR